MCEVTKLVKSAVVCCGLALVAGTLVAWPAAANPRADLRTDWNNSPDPHAIYGGCGELGSIGSAYRSKSLLLQEAGVSLENVLAITVLDCRPFGGGGGTFKVPCPAGTPYATCVANDNDGQGNAFLLGVLKRNTITEPYQRPTGCPNQSTQKMDLLLRAGEDPRLINGIVTLSCGLATGSTKIERVRCPDGPNPYAYCLAGNDGRGNRVKLGVVAANGSADPYGLYGECNDVGTQKGFLPKSSLVTKAGQSIEDVTGIEILGCSGPDASPLTRISCKDGLIYTDAYAARFAYCITGTDEKGNSIFAGVRE